MKVAAAVAAVSTGVLGVMALGTVAAVRPPLVAGAAGAVVPPSPSTSTPGTAALTLDLSPRSRADLLIADPRLSQVLAALNQHWSLTVGVVRTGHSQCIGGGSRRSRPRCPISNHWCGRGVDIFGVDGPVSRSNRVALGAAMWLLALPAPLRPDEVGGPWPELERQRGGFSDRDHLHHVHLGYEGPDC